MTDIQRAGSLVADCRLVPKVRPGGWTEARRNMFLDHLAETANVKTSLDVVGMSRAGLYKLRRRSAPFRAAWGRALEQGYARLEAELLDRALNGKRVQVERDGVIVEKIEFSDSLALNLLAQHRRMVSDIRSVTPVDREDTKSVRARIVGQIMAVVTALPDK